MGENPSWNLSRYGHWWLLVATVNRQPKLTPLGMTVFWPVGSRHESSKQHGITHFLEHVIFKKPSVFQKLKRLESEGVQINAYTTHEHVSLEIEGLSQDWPKFVDFVLDISYGFDVEEKDVQLEKQVVIQEILGQKDDPSILLDETIFRLRYGSHGLGHPITGDLKTVETWDFPSLRSYFDKFFQNSHKLLVVHGSFSLREFQQYFYERWVRYSRKVKLAGSKGYFNEPPRFNKLSWISSRSQRALSKKEILRFFWTEVQAPSGYEPFETALNYRSQQYYLAWVWPAPSYQDWNRLKIYIFQQWFSEGMTSYLYEELREKRGLVYDLSSDYYGFWDTGLFVVNASCDEPKVPILIKAFEDLLKGLAQISWNSSDWRRLKKMVKTQFVLNQERSQILTALVGLHFLYQGEILSWSRIQARYNRIQLKDWRKWVLEQFSWPKVSFVMVGPRAKKLLKYFKRT